MIPKTSPAYIIICNEFTREMFLFGQNIDGGSVMFVTPMASAHCVQTTRNRSRNQHRKTPAGVTVHAAALPEMQLYEANAAARSCVGCTQLGCLRT